MNNVYYLVAVLLAADCAFSQPFRCPQRDDCLKTGCLYQNPGNCSQFWQCDLAGRAFLKECPSGLQFNERIRVCDWPPSPTCGGGETTAVPEETTTEQVIDETTKTTETPTEAPTTTTEAVPDPGDNTVRPVEPGEFECPAGDNCLTTGCLYQNQNNCSQFWQCDLAGRAFLKQCPSGLEFNENNRVCDWPPSPTCRRVSPTTTTTTTTTTAVPTTEEPTTTTTEEPTTTTIATTEQVVEDSTTPEPTPAAPGDFDCPRGDNCLRTGCLYQNYNNCSQFWQCDLAGRAFLKECPSGLQFNERIRVCDWPPSPTCQRSQPDQL